jgi:hypothetical protein
MTCPTILALSSFYKQWNASSDVSDGNFKRSDCNLPVSDQELHLSYCREQEAPHRAAELTSEVLRESLAYSVPTAARIFTSGFYNDKGLTAAGVALLPKMNVNAKSLEELNECTVCCEGFIEGEAVVLLPCFHFLHCQCGVSWLTVMAQCPICKFSF